MTKTLDNPTIAVSIVTWNSRNEIRDCLNSLEDLPNNWEVWVADNASSDGTAELVKSEFPRVKLIANVDNLGFAGGNNQIINQTDTDYVLLLNPDTEATTEDLCKSLEIMKSDSRTGILGIRLQHEDGSLQRSCFHFPNAWLNLVDNLGLYRLFSPAWRSKKMLGDFFAHDRTRSVDWVMGAFMFVSRAAIKTAGGVPEDYFMFAEDMDWCYRVRQSGFEVSFSPEASVTHKLNRSAGQKAPDWRVRKTVLSKYLFCYLHFGKLKTRFIQLTDWLSFTVSIWRLKFANSKSQQIDDWTRHRGAISEALKIGERETKQLLEARN